MLHRLEHRVKRTNRASQFFIEGRMVGTFAQQVGGGKRAHRPTDVEEQRERAPLIGPAVVVVACRDRWDHRLEARRGLDRREPLGRAHIRCAVGSDLAVGPWLPRRPFNGVVTVARLDRETVKHPIGREASAAILHHHVVSGLGGAHRIERHRKHHRHRLVVRRSIEQHRQFFGSVRSIEICAQDSPVAHRYFDVLLNDDSRHRCSPHP